MEPVFDECSLLYDSVLNHGENQAMSNNASHVRKLLAMKDDSRRSSTSTFWAAKFIALLFKSKNIQTGTNF